MMKNEGNDGEMMEKMMEQLTKGSRKKSRGVTYDVFWPS